MSAGAKILNDPGRGRPTARVNSPGLGSNPQTTGPPPGPAPPRSRRHAALRTRTRHSSAIVRTSPGPAGLAGVSIRRAFRRTWPPSTSRAASVRDLVTRANHKHISSRCRAAMTILHSGCPYHEQLPASRPLTRGPASFLFPASCDPCAPATAATRRRTPGRRRPRDRSRRSCR